MRTPQAPQQTIAVRDRIETATGKFKAQYGQDPQRLTLGKVTARHLAREISVEMGQPVTLNTDDVYGTMKVRICTRDHYLSVGSFLHVNG